MRIILGSLLLRVPAGDVGTANASRPQANVSNLRSGGPLFKQLTHCSTGSESHGRSAQGSNRERATRTMGRTPSLCGSAGAQVNQNSKSASEFRLSGFEFRLSAT